MLLKSEEREKKLLDLVHSLSLNATDYQSKYIGLLEKQLKEKDEELRRC